MARWSTTRAAGRRRAQPLPAPLPPETRTIGQLVAETVKLYGERFWVALPLGATVGALDVVGFKRSLAVQTILLWAFTPLLTAAFVWASHLATREPLTRRSTANAFAVGVMVFLPFPVLFRLFVLPGLAFLAFAGLAVPAAVAERLGVRAAVRRGLELGRADYLHAFGGIVTLSLVYVLTRLVLLFLLRSQSDQTQEVAGFLSDLVLAPLLFLGPALLYVDQAARARAGDDA